MKVLIAEDDTNIRKGLVDILTSEGYAVVEAEDGPGAMRKFEAENPDFVCLDIMMPGLSGYEVCKRLRARNDKLPIVLISAKSEEIDKVIGLELGADDFIVKPFGVKEVIARIRAVTRRYYASQETRLPDCPGYRFKLCDLEVYPMQLCAKRQERWIELSLRDVNLLTLFYERKGEALDRNIIFNRCWGTEQYLQTRTLDQHISQLRKKIEHDPRDPKIIKTVHGVGYRYEGP